MSLSAFVSSNARARLLAAVVAILVLGAPFGVRRPDVPDGPIDSQAGSERVWPASEQADYDGPAFAPRGDTSIEGTVAVSSFVIPRGVVVTVTNDLHVVSAGEIRIDGSLVGAVRPRGSRDPNGIDISLATPADISIRAEIRAGDGLDGALAEPGPAAREVAGGRGGSLRFEGRVVSFGGNLHAGRGADGFLGGRGGDGGSVDVIGLFSNPSGGRVTARGGDGGDGGIGLPGQDGGDSGCGGNGGDGFPPGVSGPAAPTGGFGIVKLPGAHGPGGLGTPNGLDGADGAAGVVTVGSKCTPPRVCPEIPARGRFRFQRWEAGVTSRWQRCSCWPRSGQRAHPPSLSAAGHKRDEPRQGHRGASGAALGYPDRSDPAFVHDAETRQTEIRVSCR